MRPPLVVAIPSDAVTHLMDLVVAEQLRLDGVERSWPEARTWTVARDRALDRLKLDAEAGDKRSARTLDALVQATFDVEYLAIVARLVEAPTAAHDGLDGTGGTSKRPGPSHGDPGRSRG